MSLIARSVGLTLLLISVASVGFSQVSLGTAKDAATNAVLVRLMEQRRLPLRFVETPLTGVAEHFSRELGVEIFINDRALDVSGIGADSPITFSSRTRTVRSALEMILERLQLVWYPSDGALIITTPDDLNSRLETRVFPVRDLVGFTDDHGREEFYFQPIIDLITSTIASNTWEDAGGRGSIEEFSGGGAIVISQTMAVHEDIERLLTRLREATRLQGLATTYSQPQPTESTEVVPEPITRRYVRTSGAWAVPRVHRAAVRP